MSNETEINIHIRSGDRAKKEWLKHYLNIPKGFVLHHIDGNPGNDNILNLQCVPFKQHYLIHKKINLAKKEIVLKQINEQRKPGHQKVFGLKEEDYILPLMTKYPPILEEK